LPSKPSVRRGGLAVLAGILLAIPACIAPPKSALVENPVQTGRPVSLDHILVTVAHAGGKLSAEGKMLTDAVASSLRQTEMFAQVVETPAELETGDGIKLQVEITALKPVTDDARDWFGPLAGRASVTVRVQVTDLKTDRLIETFGVAGQSGQSAYAGTTPEALQMAADKIVAEMLRLNTQVEP
jgi:hypothetical protein